MKNVRRSVPDVHQVDIDPVKEAISGPDNVFRQVPAYPAERYKRWSLEEIRALIDRNFDKALTDAFEHMETGPQKADLARFALLYAVGGLCVERDIRLMNDWTVPARCGIAGFRQTHPSMPTWTAMFPGLLWSQPKRSEWTIAIDRILENGRRRPPQVNNTIVARSVLLGRAFVAAMASRQQRPESDDQWIGEIRYVTPDGHDPVPLCVSPDRVLVATGPCGINETDRSALAAS